MQLVLSVKFDFENIANYNYNYNYKLKHTHNIPFAKMLHGPASIPVLQFAAIASTYKKSDSNSCILVASPLCTILQHKALDGLEELRTELLGSSKPPSYTTNLHRTKDDLTLYYMLMDSKDEKTNQFCATVLASPSSASPHKFDASRKSSPSKSRASRVHGGHELRGDEIPVVYLCVGITGCPYIYASDPLIFELSDRLFDSTKLLQRLGKSLQKNTQEGKKWVRALLASLICDESELKTNEEVTMNLSLFTPAASDEARRINERDQVLMNLSEKMMTPKEEYDLSIRPSAKLRGNHKRSSLNASAVNSNLQYGFDYVPPLQTISSPNKNSSNHLSEKQTEYDSLPTPFKTPKKTTWRKNVMMRTKLFSIENSEDKTLKESGSSKVTPASPQHSSANSFASSEVSKSTATVTKDDDLDEVSSKVSDELDENQEHHKSAGPMRPPSSPSRQRLWTRQTVNVGLCEDLKCTYKGSKLASISIEGVIQVSIHLQVHAMNLLCFFSQIISKMQVKSPYGSQPFLFRIEDKLSHLKSFLENKTFASRLNSKLSDGLEFNVNLPERDVFVSVFKYRCSSELRPVPIRVQIRTRLSEHENICRVALQISSNPSNKSELNDLSIFMAVPPTIVGSSVKTFPVGGVWNENQRNVNLFYVILCSFFIN